MKFQVVHGVHVDSNGTRYQKGDVVETDSDLAKAFAGKFKVIEGPSARDAKRAAVKVAGQELIENEHNGVGTPVSDTPQTKKNIGGTLEGPRRTSVARAGDEDEDEEETTPRTRRAPASSASKVPETKKSE